MIDINIDGSAATIDDQTDATHRMGIGTLFAEAAISQQSHLPVSPDTNPSLHAK